MNNMNIDFIQFSLSGFPAFAIYFVIVLALLALFIAIYVRVTPYKEIELIRDGDAAAAWCLSGAVLGFAIPVANAVIHSANIVDLLIWAFVAFAAQLIAYFGVRLVIPQVASAIPQGNVACGLFLGTVSVAVGILNAACFTT